MDDTAAHSEARGCCNDVHLTQREIDALVALAAGGTNVDIGDALGISTPTAAHHVERMMGKTGATSRTALVAMAFVSGVLDHARWPPRPSGRTCLGDLTAPRRGRRSERT